MAEQFKDDDRVIVRLRAQERARMDFMADYLFQTKRIPKKNNSEMLRYALGHTFSAICEETGQDLTQVEKGLMAEDGGPTAIAQAKDVEIVIQKERMDIKEDFSDKTEPPKPQHEDMDKSKYVEDTDFFVDGGKVDPDNEDAQEIPPPKKPGKGKGKGKGTKGSGKGN